MKDSDFDRFERNWKRMFKLFVAFFVVALLATVAVWGTVAYVAVTKGPETVHRLERIGDAYANKLEQENQNKNQKPE